MPLAGDGFYHAIYAWRATLGENEGHGNALLRESEQVL